MVNMLNGMGNSGRGFASCLVANYASHGETMTSVRAALVLAILLMLFASACGVETTSRPTSLPATQTIARSRTPIAPPTKTSPPPTQSPAIQTPAPTMTPSPSAVPTHTPTAVPTPTGSHFVLLEERSIGAYTVRLWQPVPGTGMYNHATIHREGQLEIRVEAVVAIHDLPLGLTSDG